MDIDRRRLLIVSATMGATPMLTAAPAQASTSSTTFGLDAAQFGIGLNDRNDQSAAFQRAINHAARTRSPLLLAPGSYRAANLRLPSYAKLVGVRGATRIDLASDASLVTSNSANNIELSGLVLDGGTKQLARGRGLIHFSQCQGARISDCEVVNSSGNGLVLERVAGEVTRSLIVSAANTAIFSLDAEGLTISNNHVRKSGNNGIQVWRSKSGGDGTLVLDNRVEATSAKAGGSGQNGNAINIFRAGDVIVRGNHIRGAAFSAIRGNAASNLQVIANHCAELGEVAIYAEFGFQGAVIANNTVDGAVVGISVTNFNEGGRLAVVQGNLLRNLGIASDPGKGTGIAVEADSAVTGNVIENAPAIGIAVGWGPYLRDVDVSNNIVRSAGIGIAVSVVPGAGTALIANNLIAEAKYGSIVGTEWEKRVTGDLAKDSAGRYAHLSISGNRVR